MQEKTKIKTQQTSEKPQMVHLMEQLMEKQEGIEYYEKNVTNQLIEFINYYVCGTIQEAKNFRDYAGKQKIDVADMRLAIQSQNYETFVRPVPISQVAAVAEVRNKQKLPEIETVASILNETRKPPQPSSSIPTSQDATVFVNPNVQVYSEDINHYLQEQRTGMILLARSKQKDVNMQPVEIKLKKIAKKEEKTTSLGKRAGDQIKIHLDAEQINQSLSTVEATRIEQQQAPKLQKVMSFSPQEENKEPKSLMGLGLKLGDNDDDQSDEDDLFGGDKH